jgi:hypothetical protein
VLFVIDYPFHDISALNSNEFTKVLFVIKNDKIVEHSSGLEDYDLRGIKGILVNRGLKNY